MVALWGAPKDSGRVVVGDSCGCVVEVDRTSSAFVRERFGGDTLLLTGPRRAQSYDGDESNMQNLHDHAFLGSYLVFLIRRHSEEIRQIRDSMNHL